MPSKKRLKLLMGGPEGIEQWNRQRKRDGQAAISGVGLHSNLTFVERSHKPVPWSPKKHIKNSDAVTLLRGNLSKPPSFPPAINVIAWNQMRESGNNTDDLRGVDLRDTDLRTVNFSGLDLSEANLSGADLRGANLVGTSFHDAILRGADLSFGDVAGADFAGADLNCAAFVDAAVYEASLSGANLSEANLRDANLHQSDLQACNLSGADLTHARLEEADLVGANLTGANLEHAILVRTNLKGANLTNCAVYGASIWDVNLDDTKQENLAIVFEGATVITVDNIEVAQFMYLLLSNERIRHVIDTITSKVVLILGRFTPKRKPVLDAIREQLRKLDYCPVMFDFPKPASRDFIESVSALAHMSRFVIADFTSAKIVLEEVPHIVRNLSVPVVPLIQGRTAEPITLNNLRRNHRSVLPTHRYRDTDDLVASLGQDVIQVAESRAQELGS